ncbi:hypothetical protein CmeUKMEL1_06155 [Cryptosporidium meleagridis]|uniref:Uncharacterized protein n=1 Tax=Cryptosporidium meleagridis TaxID=93969 RepID=A0A2P4YZP1_9CRYT|nr:hypothetical protein CmeUKMEL1_06155 [Cryptosporidium meleagridis]
MQLSMQQMQQQKYSQYHSQQITPQAQSSHQQHHIGNPYQQTQNQGQYHSQQMGIMQGPMVGPDMHGGNSTAGAYGQSMGTKRGVQPGGMNHPSAQIINTQGSHGNVGGIGGISSSSMVGSNGNGGNGVGIGNNGNGGNMSRQVNTYMGYSGMQSRGGSGPGDINSGMGEVVMGAGMNVNGPGQAPGVASHQVSTGARLIPSSSSMDGQRYSNASSNASCMSGVGVGGGGGVSGTSSGLPSNENSVSGNHKMVAGGITQHQQQAQSMQKLEVSGPGYIGGGNAGTMGGNSSEIWVGGGNVDLVAGGGPNSSQSLPVVHHQSHSTIGSGIPDGTGMIGGGVGGMHSDTHLGPSIKQNSMNQHYNNLNGNFNSNIGAAATAGGALNGVQVTGVMDEAVGIAGTGPSTANSTNNNTGVISNSNLNINIADKTNNNINSNSQ